MSTEEENVEQNREGDHLKFKTDDEDLKKFIGTELVGLSEITIMIKRHPHYSSNTRQRAFELTQHPDFPPSLPVTLARGRLWYRSDVAVFLDKVRPPGPPSRHDTEITSSP